MSPECPSGAKRPFVRHAGEDDETVNTVRRMLPLRAGAQFRRSAIDCRMRPQPPRPWITVVDGPARRAVCVAHPVTRHWCPTRVFEEGEHYRVLAVAQADDKPSLVEAHEDEIVFVEMACDANGAPLQVPKWFNVDLMGSMTIWPGLVKQFVWSFDSISVTTELGGDANEVMESLRRQPYDTD